MIFQLLLLLPSFSVAGQDCNILKKLLDCDDINTILDFHNEKRQLVASGQTSLEQARDMWVLKWDEKLAEEAQSWADTCTYMKNENKPYEYGENLASYTGSKEMKVDLERLLRMWFDEIKNYDPNILFDIYNTGHFTQLIWADTKYVGCGISEFIDKRNRFSPYKVMLVCNYKPPGNYPDEKPYEHYDWIRCEKGIESKEYEGLCAHSVEHAKGNYMPCSGCNLKPTAIFFTLFLLYIYYRYEFSTI